MRVNYRPLTSLQAGCWFKLICGASYQHLPTIRNLALAYAIAGADCIDVSADPAVVEAVREAFSVISQLRSSFDPHRQLPFSLPADLPLLMVSFSDGEDPHFRKATFDPDRCPSDCLRPCESICPAAAIALDSFAGVIEERCYGCGRCLPVCPIQHIETVTRATSVKAIAPTLLKQVDAIEIHTQVGRYDEFMALWAVLRPYVDDLAVISISCPEQDGVIDYLWQLYEGLQPLPIPLIWQTDGRPMSGDIGNGTTHATLRFAQKVLQAGPPGFVQLAGGTNAHTVTKMTDLTGARSPTWGSVSPRHVGRSALPPSTFGGIAYGSYARRLLSSLLDEAMPSSAASVSTVTSFPSSAYALDSLEALANQLIPAVQLAQSLVAPLKAAHSSAPNSSLQPVGPSSSLETPFGTPSALSSFE